MSNLQIIVPVYNEQEVVDLFYEKMKQILSTSDVQWTILFVDDGSTDGTVQHIELLRHKDDRVGYITLSRNFGKEYALTAGLDHADADVVVVIDVDLQDPPELIPLMLDEWHKGFDVVYATRKARAGETMIKKATASWFYKVINKMSKISIPLPSDLVCNSICLFPFHSFMHSSYFPSLFSPYTKPCDEHYRQTWNFLKVSVSCIQLKVFTSISFP